MCLQADEGKIEPEFDEGDSGVTVSHSMPPDDFIRHQASTIAQ